MEIIMKEYDIFTTERKRENEPLTLDSIESMKLLREYRSIFGPDSLKNLNSIVALYNSLTDSFKKEVLERLLDKYNYNYSYSLHNSSFLATMRDCDKPKYLTKSLYYPGIEQIVSQDNQVFIESKIGNVTITKADSIFKGTKSEQIFTKELIGKCYARTYDFLKLNRKHYKAVVSYLPNAFVGGHYHAYLESKAHILDIAGNAVFSHEDAKVIIQGETLLRLSLEELEKKYIALRREIPSLAKDTDLKLHILALEHDFKNAKK